MKAGREHHICPACGRRTYRRIRRFPTLGNVDARCDVCYKKNYRPETIQHYDPRTSQAVIKGIEVPETSGYRPLPSQAVEPVEEADQGAFFQDEGS